MANHSVPNPYPRAVRVWCPSGGSCVVQPGSVNLGRAATMMKWHNDTKDIIDILIPCHGKSDNVRTLSLSPGEIGCIDIPKLDDDKYLYAVYSHECKQFAVGGSEPEMIVP